MPERLPFGAILLSKRSSRSIDQRWRRAILKALQPGDIFSINLETVSSLAEAFLMHLEDYKSWFIESGKNYELSKVLFFLVLMQACVIKKNRSGQFLEVCNAIFPVLKAEWKLVESTRDTSVEMLKEKLLNWDCRGFLDHCSQLCASTLFCIFWRLLEAFTSAITTYISSGYEDKLVCVYHDLFIFFAISGFRNFFKEHLHYLVKNFKIFPVRSLRRFFTEEGNNASWSCFLDKLLVMMVEQKTDIIR